MPELRVAGDCALLVEFGREITPANHRRVLALLERLAARADGDIVHVQPAYASVLVRFDARRTDHAAVAARLRGLLDEAGGPTPAPQRTVEIPVCYGGELGPDLASVAARARMSEEEAAAAHAAAEYHVHFLGFLPGFAYLAGLPPRLSAPRLASPRRLVPAGSVAVAGRQAAVYPSDTPGGWNLIGRTPLVLFSAAREPMSVLRIGDAVRFKPISRDEFQAFRA